MPKMLFMPEFTGSLVCTRMAGRSLEALVPRTPLTKTRTAVAAERFGQFHRFIDNNLGRRIGIRTRKLEKGKTQYVAIR